MLVGMPVAGEVNPISYFCFAIEINELARLLLGNKDEPQ